MASYYIFREEAAGQPFDPAAPLQFCPPKGSDELFFALRAAFPDVPTHSERMRNAVIAFLVHEGQLAQASSHQSSPMIANESVSTSPYSPYLSMTSSTSSFSASPPAQTPASSTAAESSQSAASRSRPDMEQMTTVFSISSHSQPKLRSRRRMTEAEKIEYRKKRSAGACQACSARKRKCKHNKTQDNAAAARATKPATQKSRGKQPQPLHINPPPSTVASIVTESSTTDSLIDFNDSDLIDFFNFDDASSSHDLFTSQELLLNHTEAVHTHKYWTEVNPGRSSSMTHQPQPTLSTELFAHGDFELFPQSSSAGFGEAHEVSARAPSAQILQDQPHLIGIESMLTQDPRGGTIRAELQTHGRWPTTAMSGPTSLVPQQTENSVLATPSQSPEYQYMAQTGSNSSSAVRHPTQALFDRGDRDIDMQSSTSYKATLTTEIGSGAQSSPRATPSSHGPGAWTEVRARAPLQTLQPQLAIQQLAGLQLDAAHPAGHQPTNPQSVGTKLGCLQSTDTQPVGLQQEGPNLAVPQPSGQQSAGSYSAGSPRSPQRSMTPSNGPQTPQDTATQLLTDNPTSAACPSQVALPALLRLVSHTQWSLLYAMQSAADVVEQQPHRGMAENMHVVAAC